MFFIGILGAVLLAFANGANDISKSIATLVGTGESHYRRAVVLASLAVAAGASAASLWAVKMTLLFTKGMLSPAVVVNELFALAVLAGAVGWVLLATRWRMPVSTTHAIVGSVVVTGWYAFGTDGVLWGAVTRKVVLPLLLSPLLAFAFSGGVFAFLHWLCRRKYCINCHWAHWASALSSGFARGLNDTPKMAALALVFYLAMDPQITMAPAWFFLVLAVANAVGGLVAGLRVTDTLAHRVTKLDHLEGFSANLTTSLLVILTALKGWPVSTTHVSSTAIMGMGLQKKGIDWGTVGRIAAAWLLTLPAAGLLALGTYALLKS